MYHDFTSLLAGFNRKQMLKWRAEEQARRQQNIQDNYKYTAQYIQEALTIILMQSSYPKLIPVTRYHDIVPCGYNILSDDTLYYFWWAKKDCDMPIGRPLLDRLRDNLNCQIDFFRHQFFQSFNRLPDCDKVLYVQLYPAIYNGFHVVDCIDDDTHIILACKTD